MYENKTLQEINDEQVRVLIPAIIVIVVFMIIGLTGNPLVIFFYGCKLKPTASYMFIVAVACFDLVICAISMPLELVDLIHFYTFPSSEACRLVRFLNYFASMASGSTLVAVAVDRFRRICRPFDEQISTKLARIIIILIVVSCFILAMPSFVFYKVVPVNITSDSDIIGFDCTTIRDDNYVLYITIYNIFCFILFIITITVLIVLYCLVGKQLFRLKKRQTYAQKPSTPGSSFEEFSSTSVKKDRDQSTILSPKNIERDCSNDTVLETISDQEQTCKTSKTNNVQFQNPDKPNNNICKPDVSMDTSKPETSEDLASASEVPSTMVDRVGKASITRKKYQRIRSEKYTIVTFSISAAFILSFLPYLALVTWRTLTPDYEPNLMSDSQLVAFQIFIRSFLFNSGCNPVIYGLLNSEFKHMVISGVRRIFCCKGGEPYDIDQSYKSS